MRRSEATLSPKAVWKHVFSYEYLCSESSRGCWCTFPFPVGLSVWNNHTVCWLKLWPRIQNGSAGPSWRAQIRWSCLLQFPRRVRVLSFQLWVSHTKTKTVKSKLWDSSPGGGDSVGFQTYERAPGVLGLLFLSCKHPEQWGSAKWAVRRILNAY